MVFLMNSNSTPHGIIAIPKKINAPFFIIQLISTIAKAPIAHLESRYEKPGKFFAEGLNRPFIQKTISTAPAAATYGTRG